MHGDYTLRQATVDDAPIIGHHRRAMFLDMGHPADTALDTMSARLLPWLTPKLQNGEYLAWFAIAPDGSVAAGLGVWLMDWPPHMVGAGARRANILNVYTQPEHRRRGLARSLMETALDWCRENGISTVILHASNEGRPLYEFLGFRPTNEMRLMLRR
jgi:GNAT superfamily N-acetyltransferase